MDEAYPELDTQTDTQLQEPDLEQLRQDRLDRNRAFFESVSPAVAARVLPHQSQGGDTMTDVAERSAVTIQKHWRGVLGRKVYTSKLYEQFLKEEETQLERARQQVEEGELLVENHELEVLLDDRQTTRRNAQRLYLSKVIILQRAWRRYLEKQVSGDHGDGNYNHSNSNLLAEHGLDTQARAQSEEAVTGNVDNKIEKSLDTNTESQPVDDTERVDFNTKVEKAIINPLSEQLHNTGTSGTRTYEIDDAVTDKTNDGVVNLIEAKHEQVIQLSSSVCDTDIETNPDQKQALLTDTAPGAGSQGLKPPIDIVKHSDETDHDFRRRVRKHSLLSQAQEFVELKKLNSDVLPFNLHQMYPPSAPLVDKGDNYSNMVDAVSQSAQHLCDEANVISDTGSGPGSDQLQLSEAESSKLDESRDLVSDAMVRRTKEEGMTNTEGEGVSGDGRESFIKGDNHIGEKSGRSGSIETHGVEKTSTSKTMGDTSGCDVTDPKSKGDNPHVVISDHAPKGDISGCDDSILGAKGDNCDDVPCAFDVYNIETALPDVDWKSLEEKLIAAREEEDQRQQARRNDREEIRKKLAMGVDDEYYDDNDDDDDDISYKKPNLQSRLHSGLQICFMNESPGDTDSEGLSPRQHEIHDNMKLMSKVSDLVDSDNNLRSVMDLNKTPVPAELNKTTVDEAPAQCSPPRLKTKLDGAENPADLKSKQEQLQNEAKLALAQAGTMAHMQLEIEKQTKKKSPIAEMAGIPGLGERRRKKLGIRKLQEMNLAQIQVLYNDLQTQIESLNEELVHLLMERDELHMEQDSMLVDIEDLTRRAEEIAEKTNSSSSSKAAAATKGKAGGR